MASKLLIQDMFEPVSRRWGSGDENLDSSQFLHSEEDEIDSKQQLTDKIDKMS